MGLNASCRDTRLGPALPRRIRFRSVPRAVTYIAPARLEGSLSWAMAVLLWSGAIRPRRCWEGLQRRRHRHVPCMLRAKW
jgi:hypothetical protein